MEIINFKSFENWLELYKKAWEERNPDLVSELFADDIVMRETPYTAPFEGLEAVKKYWEEGARDSQMNIEFSYEVIAVKSNHAFAKWNAEFDRISNKVQVKLDGILEVQFNEKQKAVIFNEWWHRKEIKPNIKIK